MYLYIYVYICAYINIYIQKTKLNIQGESLKIDIVKQSHAV